MVKISAYALDYYRRFGAETLLFGPSMHATPHDVPPWVFRLLDVGRPQAEPSQPPPFRQPTHGLRSADVDRQGWSASSSGCRRRVLETADWKLVSLCLQDAVDLDLEAFQDRCEGAYHRLCDAFEEGNGAWYVVRWWNFIPRILDPLGDVEHRYMAFNAGRHRAMERRLAEIPRVATASGVGHFGQDLWIHGLAARAAGHAVENPRQIPAYRYSSRFGPVPPCFARATRIHAAGRPTKAPWLLVGGTASVRGEDSLFPGQIERQTAETLRNLSAVVRAGFGCKDPQARFNDALATFHNLRVYLVDPALKSAVSNALTDHFDDEVKVEYLHADLCRPDLLVEIEGLADLSRRPVLAREVRRPTAFAHSAL